MRTKSETLLWQHETEIEKLKSFLTSGNAGGAIATLGLMGATIGISAGNLAPRPMFWVLAIFLLGLFGIWFAAVSSCFRLIAETEIGRLPKGDEMTPDSIDQTGPLVRRWWGFFWCEAFGLSISSLSLICGANYGLLQLFYLTV